MSADLLAVDRVTKSYAFGGLFGGGAFNAVDDVSFRSRDAAGDLHHRWRVRPGKTTLARMTLNLIAPRRRHPLPRRRPVHIRGARARMDFMRNAADLSEPV